ncbi:UNVERIFIED_CONTAM: hypothetical protein Scaly_1057900 [Sesamum calycinum]|uniref:Uncharacterized protein n=1 Tax=Sesamum calycinum TaxID=2727403 RepID=A0AAW2QKF9_9LAMI
MPEYYNWTSHGEDIVQDYFEALGVPQVSEEPTPADYVEGIPNDGTRSCPVNVGPTSYCYGGGLYDYDESGLPDPFSNIVHAADQPLCNGCTQSQLGVVAELNIALRSHSARRLYNRKKLVKDLGLPVEKIHACNNGCILYWKDDVDLEYCKFSGEARYKPSRGRDPHQKKSPYVVLMYLPITPRLQRLYSLTPTARAHDGMPHIRQRRGRCVIHSMPSRTYSCWSVIITPYNLLPSMCMSFEYILLTMGALQKSLPSSQASVTPNEQQLWMSTAGGRKRGRVFDLDSEAHHTIAGPSQSSSSTAPMPSPPQLQSDDLRDRVQIIERYIRSHD